MQTLNEGTNAFVFPGTSVSLCGYEAEFFTRNVTVFDPLFTIASQLSLVDLKTILFAKNQKPHTECDFQIFTFAFSCGFNDVLIRKGFNPSVISGYSMGIYSALYSAGVLSFSECISLIKYAFQIMYKTVENEPFGMGAIIGLSREEIDSAIAQSGTAISIVNSNNDTCHIVSGKSEEIDQIFQIASEIGAIRTVQLDAKIPYHHPVYMQKTSDLIRPYLDTLEWKKPLYPIVSSIDQRMLQTAEECKELVIKNLSSPINWTNVMQKLINDKYFMFFEVGPGISLTQNGRFISTDVRFVNVKNVLHRLGL